jgi:hypothetical protein
MIKDINNIILEDLDFICKSLALWKDLRSYPSIDKISQIGWKPSIDLRQDFSRTIKSFLV